MVKKVSGGIGAGTKLYKYELGKITETTGGYFDAEKQTATDKSHDT